MNKKVMIIGAVAITTLGGGIVADNQINPYVEKSNEFVLEMKSDLPEVGKAEIAIKKDKPEVRFKKWNNEVDFGITYSKVKEEGSRKLLTKKVEWKDTDEEIHAYPVENGFEIEIYLKKRPKTNVFEFDIDGYENLDFFYQPRLTQEEIDDGAFRPENVIGSYAVYHKTKVNHIIGQTNYATGKAFHIYRPKAIDDNGVEKWGDLNVENGKLFVKVNSVWLDEAKYPVIIDPTFGYESIGESNMTSDNDRVKGTRDSPSLNGETSQITFFLHESSYDNGPRKLGLYDISEGLTNSPFVAGTGEHSGETPNDWVSHALVTNVYATKNYAILHWGEQTSVRYDITDWTNGYLYTSLNYPGSGWSATLTLAHNDSYRFSIYTTYTATGGGTVRSTPILNAGSIILNAGTFINN